MISEYHPSAAERLRRARFSSWRAAKVPVSVISCAYWASLGAISRWMKVRIASRSATSSSGSCTTVIWAPPPLQTPCPASLDHPAAVLEPRARMLESAEVGGDVAAGDQNVGGRPLPQDSAVIDAEQVGGFAGGRLDGQEGLQAGLGHEGDLVGDPAVGVVGGAGVGAGHRRHPGGDGGPERAGLGLGGRAGPVLDPGGDAGAAE